MESASDGTTNASQYPFQNKLEHLFGKMPSPMKFKRGWLLLIGASISFLVFYSAVSRTTNKMAVDPDVVQPSRKILFEGYTVWPEFNSEPVMTNYHFQTQCAKTPANSISRLTTILEDWSSSGDRLCRSFYTRFKSIFSVESRQAPVSYPDKFYAKVKEWMGNKPELIAELPSQTVIHIVNKYTREHTIFNLLRDKRPVKAVDKSTELRYFNGIVANTSSTCDFCNFREMTAEHPFGRIESQHSFTASNAFKLDTLHALVALKQHNPLSWSREQFLDVMRLTLTWLDKAKKHFPQSRYPSMIWDVLPHCGASQVHPHIHVMFDPTRYHGVIENWRQSGQEYFNLFDSNFFSDVIGIYSALNLTVRYGKAVAFPNLVPRKDHEVIVMAKEADADFFNLLYIVLRAFVDDLQKFCYSMGMAYPALGGPDGKIPAYARIITRGAVTELRNDMSSLELFTATNVNIDPWKTKQILEASLQKRFHPSR